ncbi:MAG: phage Gp37/Gp68 family protein [Longimicrobiales bacterium]
MRDRSSIEWTDSTWNPVTGCTKVSAGCDNCYAHALAHGRLRDVYLKQLPVLRTKVARQDPFAVRIWPERLMQPGRWADPRLIFVNSMSDLFHGDIPVQFVRDVFLVMLNEDRHIYQVLTKRPSRAARFLEQNRVLLGDECPSHIWIGTSVEDMAAAHRVRHLQAAPAAVRFLSCEPLLGPLELDLEGIHWVIVGGESGIGYRPMHPDWVCSIREQCEAAGVPFFFKQWGGRTPKAGGRLLDGREWNGYPERHVPAVS